MKNDPFILAALTAINFMACSTVTDEEQWNFEDNNKESIVAMVIPDLIDGTTRMDISIVGNNIKAVWAKNDTVGIYPVIGGQVEFPMSTQAGTNYAEFDGGAWGLRKATKYSAYFPYDRKNALLGNKAIPIDYTGQKQDVNNSVSNLAEHDYLATGAVETNADGSIVFSLTRLSSVVRFALSIPDAGTFDSFSLVADDDIFNLKSTMDITGTSPVLTPTETSKTFTINLNNFTANEGDNVYVFALIPPTNMSSSSVKAQLHRTDGTIFETALTGSNMNLKANTTYGFNVFKSNNIEFADDAVKAICISNWDTNNDGELSYVEAAAVFDIGTTFSNNTEIQSFDELTYFKGLTTIADEAFYNCTNLASIKVPDNITSFGKRAITSTKITAISLPHVTTLVDQAFADCTSIVSIDIPNVETVGCYAFSGCTALENVNAPKVKTVDHDAFAWTTNLKYLNLPEATTFYTEGSEYAMFWNSGITELNLPKLSSDIVNYFGAPNLTSLSLPCVTNIISSGSGAFRGSSLISVDLPNVKSIGEETFRYCSALETINIPNVETIGDRAFEECSSLASINLPQTISIGTRAFAVCNNLKAISAPRLTTVGMYAFGETAIEEINLPLAIEINYNAFIGCKQLKTAILPNINIIRKDAFDNTSLETLYLGTGTYGLRDGYELDASAFGTRTDLSQCSLYLPMRFASEGPTNLDKIAFKEVIYQ